jgi:hypothetical protein
VWTGWRSRRSAGRRFGDGQQHTSIEQHSRIFPLTTRFAWITLAPQESRDNHLDGNRRGPGGSNGASELWPVHTLWLLPWSPASDTSPASLGRHLPSSSTGDRSPRETRSAPRTRRPPRVAVDSGGRRCGMRSVRSRVTSGLRQGLGNERCPVWAVREPSIVTRDVGIACLIGVPTANRPGPGRPGGRPPSDHRDRTRAPRCRCGRG